MNSTSITPSNKQQFSDLTKSTQNQTKFTQKHSKNEENQAKTAQNSPTFVTTIAIDDAPPHTTKADSPARTPVIITRSMYLPFKEKRACLILPRSPFRYLQHLQIAVIKQPFVSFAPSQDLFMSKNKGSSFPPSQSQAAVHHLKACF